MPGCELKLNRPKPPQHLIEGVVSKSFQVLIKTGSMDGQVLITASYRIRIVLLQLKIQVNFHNKD